MFPVQKRANEMKAEFDEMIHKRVAAYPKFNYEYEMSVIRGTESVNMSTTSLTTKHNNIIVDIQSHPAVYLFVFKMTNYFLVSLPFGEEIAKRKILIMNIAKENRQNGINEESCKSHIYLI